MSLPSLSLSSPESFFLMPSNQSNQSHKSSKSNQGSSDKQIAELGQALRQIDSLIDMLPPILAEASPENTEHAITQLRDTMAAFADLAQKFQPSAFTPANVTHMEHISERLTQIRGHITKLSAITQQQLQALIPQGGGAHTYGANKIPPGAAASVSRLYHISG